ncbi:MAG: amino acid adenylation domain-containing protein, partial [Chloroflexi bacterium]|nr:amino acid adenylation domain-containing protein [Chloroflexota bacterium]
MANWVEQNPQALMIERLLVGVEPILETTLARIQTQLPHATILNGYGPTEATVCVTLHEFKTTNPKAKPIPIGRPIQNTQIYLLNRQMEPVPPGIAGELYIGGAGLAHGYWRRPELTEKSFIPNPFISGERIYKTGDMARYLPDSTIEFLGRRDFQVKVRGYRVELGEIEAILHQHDSIAQASVVTQKDAVGNNYLIAYVVINKNESFNEPSLRDFLLQKLPDYMVPSTFVSLDVMPLTANDKVDRKALQDSYSKFEDEAYVAPQSPIEGLIANTFTAVLGIEMVGRHASFLQLGGHSLLATQVISRLNHALHLDLPLRLIFTHPKVADLATAVTRQLTTENTTTPFIFTQADRSQPLPLSFAQQRLWFLQQLEPENTAYNIPLALKLEGNLDTAVLEQSLNELLRRHDSLRTIFPDSTEPPQQIILPHTHFALPIVNVSAGSNVETAVQTHIRDEAQTTFNLAESALRLRLLRLSPTHHVLLFTTHHIISDGWSHALFTRELAALYDAHKHARPAALPPLAYQYADFASAQRNWLQGEVLDKLTTYWQHKLDCAPEQLGLPTDFTRPIVQTHTAKHLRYQLDAEQSRALRKLCQHEDATLFMGLLAAFKTLLHRLSHQNDIVVGAPIANRNHLQTEQLIGFFINTLVLHTQLHPDMPFSEFLQAVRDTTLTAYAHQDMPFEKLVELLQPGRDLSQTPFFHVFFNMVNVPDPESQLSDVTMTQMPWGDVSAKFDLTLYVTETAVNITFELVYNSDLFSAERMDAFLGQYVSLLTQITQNSAAPLASYTLIPATTISLPDPTALLTPEWHPPAHQFLTTYARTQPDQIAIHDATRQLTYAELEQRSNQLAHFLLANGIGKNDIVAIYAARNADLPLAILATHKAGAAFLILDPAYPSTRLHTYLQQAQPKAWIQLAAAGEVPTLLTNYLDECGISCRLSLPNSQLNIYPSEPPQIIIAPDDLATLTFTSGTTGKPRAIASTHRPLAHFWAWQTAVFNFTPHDQFTLFSGLAHDPLLRDLFTPLVNGGTLHIPTAETLYSASALTAWMAERHITVTHLPPALGQMMTTGSTSLSTLRYAFWGGEALPATVVEALQQMAPDVRSINFYGTTETPQAMAMFDTTNGIPKTIAPIGHGIDGVQLLILTPTMQLAGIGELGQIAVRAPYLARGYVGDATLTEAKFIRNPFVPTAPEHDKIYLTGDNGRFLPDGSVEYIGRTDGQINLRGFRIELGEIEAAITHHPAVAQAVARLHDAEQLIAYMVAQEDAADEEEIRTFLQATLPNYMIPSRFIWLPQFPLTPNGKLDVRALPTPDFRGETAVIIPSSTYTETALVAIWSDVLQTNQFG